MSTQPNYTHLAPNAEDLEQAVLGAILTDAGALGTAYSLLRGTAEVFYQPRHQYVFRAAMHLSAAGHAVDLLSVRAELTRRNWLEKTGTVTYLSELMLRVQSAANLPTHCLKLLELYTLRTIGTISRTLTAKAYDLTQDPNDLLAEAQQALNKMHEALQMRRPMSVGELHEPVLQEIARATQASGGLTGVPSGLTALDRVTGGFQEANLIIIAARPGMGKTSIALSMARFAAGQDYPGGFFTLEMGNRELVRKMIGTEAGYTTSQLQRGLLPGKLEEVESIRAKTQALATLNLHLDDTPGLSIGELRAKATKMKADHNIRFLVVDYLQLMKGDVKGSREQEISSISRGLKLLAKELNIPVLALSQLSRSVESRGGEKKPQLSDLRESGAIEQDADLVIFPYRPEAYGILEDDLGFSTVNTTELIIAKHRNGALDTPVVKSVMSQGIYCDLDLSPAPAGERPMYVGNGETVAFGALPLSNDFARIEEEAF